jgi:hypothetical protein
MKLSALFGIKSRLRRLRIMAGEGAIALEDRSHLLRFAWQDEKDRLRLMLGMMIAVVGLTTVAIALLSVAFVVQFWDTPQRNLVAWLVAALWVGLWIVAVAILVTNLRKASVAFEPARETFERDLAWFHASFGSDDDDEDEVRRPPPPVSREELLARIERQRQRVQTLQAAASDAGAAPVPSETASATAVRLAREHPVATGMAAAAVLAVMGPRRMLRWATVIAPVLWRMR